MAYLGFEFGLAVVDMAPSTVVEDHLEPLERQAVLVSRYDDLRSVEAPGRSARLREMVFGERRAMRLADSRLEALRRFAVISRLTGDRLDPEEHQRALDAGLSSNALDETKRLVAPWRATRRPTGMIGDFLLIGLSLAAGLLIFPLLEDVTGDWYAAAVLLGAAIVTALPFLLAGERRP